MCPTNFSNEFAVKSMESSLFTDKLAGNLPAPDIHVITSGGLRIPAHSHILVFFFYLFFIILIYGILLEIHYDTKDMIYL